MPKVSNDSSNSESGKHKFTFNKDLTRPQERQEPKSTSSDIRHNVSTDNSMAKEIALLKAENERLRKRCEELEFNGLELIDDKTVSELTKERNKKVTVKNCESFKVQRTQKYAIVELTNY